MKAWHFLHSSKRLRSPDSRLVQINIWYSVKGNIKLCKNGMHGSKRLIDALKYAPAPIVCRAEIKGEILEDADKLAGRKRRVVAMADATNVLHEFACWCAEGALKGEEKAGRKTDPRSWAAIQAKRRWLKGDTTDEELIAARSAAWSTAWSTARSSVEAAWSAADSAVESAVESARLAARSAVDSSAWSAVDLSARFAVKSAQNKHLTRKINQLLKND